MLQKFWPILLIVGSNIFYHICSKSSPEALNPFAGLTVTYLIGAIVSAACFYLLTPGNDLLAEYRNINWTTIVLGIAIVGLEVGANYMYRVGWDISTGQLVHSSLLAICLIFVGWLAYHEALTPSKLIGIAVCLIGLYLINK